MNEPSDETLLASARRALAGAAPAEPSPALLAAVRREAARRARLVRFRRAFFPAAAAAAAVLLVLARPGPTGPRPSSGGGARTAPADRSADAALRLLLFDASLAAASEDGTQEDSGAAATAGDGDGWDSLSFSEALLAWQESPLADYADSVY